MRWLTLSSFCSSFTFSPAFCDPLVYTLLFFLIYIYFLYSTHFSSTSIVNFNFKHHPWFKIFFQYSFLAWPLNINDPTLNIFYHNHPHTLNLYSLPYSPPVLSTLSVWPILLMVFLTPSWQPLFQRPPVRVFCCRITLCLLRFVLCSRPITMTGEVAAAGFLHKLCCGLQKDAMRLRSDLALTFALTDQMWVACLTCTQTGH